MATATVTSKGQITIPAKVRAELGVEPGDKIEFVDMGQGQFAIVAATRSIRELDGVFRDRVRKPVSIEEMNATIARRGSSPR